MQHCDGCPVTVNIGRCTSHRGGYSVSPEGYTFDCRPPHPARRSRQQSCPQGSARCYPTDHAACGVKGNGHTRPHTSARCAGRVWPSTAVKTHLSETPGGSRAALRSATLPVGVSGTAPCRATPRTVRTKPLHPGQRSCDGWCCAKRRGCRSTALNNQRAPESNGGGEPMGGDHCQVARAPKMAS